MYRSVPLQYYGSPVACSMLAKRLLRAYMDPGWAEGGCGSAVEDPYGARNVVENCIPRNWLPQVLMTDPAMALGPQPRTATAD